MFGRHGMQVLMWIACSKTPLDIAELIEALAVGVGDIRLNEENKLSPTQILESCFGLVYLENTTVRLVHHTVTAFLQKNMNVYFPNAMETISLTCLTYLKFETFVTNEVSETELKSLLSKTCIVGTCCLLLGGLCSCGRAECSNPTSY